MKFKSLILLPTMAMCVMVSGCQSDLSIKYDDMEIKDIDDNYETFYQIFPASYSDSDGNGKGDLQGIIDKLDYIDSLNYTGIWLNPIHPSHTDHHYDVEDYMAVSSEFGTLAKLDELISKCHEKGIKVILDMVLNHSSNQHQWFQTSYLAAKANKINNQYYKYYNWISCPGNPTAGYRKVNSSDTVAYEGRFDTSMPDFNLDQIIAEEETDLKTEFRNIFTFWLKDHKVDGFRLDATAEFFSGERDKNLQVLTWINQECKKINPKCYIVGEGSWQSNSQDNKLYQTSGIDSFFEFANSVQNTGYIQQIVGQSMANRYPVALSRNRETANGGIEAPFLGNHDTPRYVGGVLGRKEVNNAKFAMGILAMLGGTTFTYYGDEVGLASQDTTADGWFRLPIRWGSDDTHNVNMDRLNLYGVTSSKLKEDMSYPHPDVATQLKDKNSLVNYVKKANLLRKQIPELSRGDSEEVFAPVSSFNITKRTYNNSSICVAINASKSEPYTIDYSLYGEKVIAELTVNDSVTLKSKGSKEIIIPAMSIVIIK